MPNTPEQKKPVEQKKPPLKKGWKEKPIVLRSVQGDQIADFCRDEMQLSLERRICVLSLEETEDCILLMIKSL